MDGKGELKAVNNQDRNIKKWVELTSRKRNALWKAVNVTSLNDEIVEL